MHRRQRGRSSARLERLPVTQEVAGSSPVGPASLAEAGSHAIVHTFHLAAILALGFFLGMRHATDADHVVAVSTIVARHSSLRQAALVGAAWGVGHTLTIFSVGSAIILFGWVVPVRVGLSMEFSVAVMLVVLGMANLFSLFRWRSPLTCYGLNTANEAVQGRADTALGCGSKTTRWLDSHFSDRFLYRFLRPFVVGLVHGLAGSAAVALLVLTTIQDPLWALGYLLVFGIGTVLGMVLITTAIGWPLVYSSRYVSSAGQIVRTISGIVSLSFGLLLVYELGVVQGLFSAHPRWIPR
jgi:high-affinity nickel permease